MNTADAIVLHRNRSIYIIGENDRCATADCYELVTDIVYDRKTSIIGGYCRKHAEIVVEEDRPEYQTTCPNCDCLFGVN